MTSAGAPASLELYQQRVAENQAVADSARRRRNVLSWLRLAVFLLLAAAIYRLATSPADRLPGTLGGVLLLGAFIRLVVLQRRPKKNAREARISQS